LLISYSTLSNAQRAVGKIPSHDMVSLLLDRKQGWKTDWPIETVNSGILEVSSANTKQLNPKIIFTKRCLLRFNFKAVNNLYVYALGRILMGIGVPF